MRRVYDDSHLNEIGDFITETIRTIPADTVSLYSYGMYRTQVYKVREAIQNALDKKFGKGTVIFGKNEHANGIGNNNAIEIIFNDKEEQQICGLLHLTDNMYGGCIAFVTDIDGDRRDFAKRNIRGCDKNSNFFRFSGFEDKNGWLKNYHDRENERRATSEKIEARCKTIPIS